MKPVIAMPKLSNDPFRIYMKSKYVFSLWRSGARVRWIRPENTEKNRRLLLECDGLLMPGGVDIEPARYGQKPQRNAEKSILPGMKQNGRFWKLSCPQRNRYWVSAGAFRC